MNLFHSLVWKTIVLFPMLAIREPGFSIKAKQEIVT